MTIVLQWLSQRKLCEILKLNSMLLA